MTNSASVPHDTVMGELFAKDPDFVRESISLALEEGNVEELMILLRQLAVAHGGIPALARQTGLHEKSLYRTLSPKGNPQFTTIHTLLSAMGLKLVVMPM